MGCPRVHQITYSDFSKRIQRRLVAERVPIDGSIEPTFRCNLRCAHCYCNLALDDKDALERELKTEEVLDILDQIAEAGCLWLLITGGEPLVRDDFLDIYAYAKKKGFIINLFTNGTLLTSKIADYLAEWLPFRVEITLYGITKKTYERVTGITGSFEACMKGIDLLLQHRIPLELKTMVMTLNRDELWQIKDYAEKIGVDFRFDPVINPRLDGSKSPCSLRISPQEIVELDLADEKRAKAWQKLCNEEPGDIRRDRLYICGAGINMFNIGPYGQMSGCQMTRFHNYNLRCNSFKEGWYHSIPEFLALEPEGSYQCADCDLIKLCNQCPGWAWLENGDLRSPVEYLCRLTHLRAEAFGKRRKGNEQKGRKYQGEKIVSKAAVGASEVST